MKQKRFMAVLTTLVFLLTAIIPNLAWASSSSTFPLSFGFEDGATAGWNAKGGEKLTASEDVSNAGKYSMKVAGRTQFWEGPEIDLTGKAVKGEKYDVSAWVYQNSGSAQEFRVTAYSLDDSSTNPYEGKFYTTVAQDKAIPSGKWTLLKGVYTFDYSGTHKKLTIYVESPQTGYDFYVDDILITGPNITQKNTSSIETDIPSLYDAYKNYFSIGVAVPSSVFNDPTKVALIKKHFNSITAEYEMKQQFMQPKEGEFNYSISDKYIQFIQDNSMRLRGHALVWHISVPDWMFVDSNGKDVTREVLLERLKNHIQTVVSKYKGKIAQWDVVNEAIDADQPNNLRNTKWLQIIGPDYIEYAFKYAHEADPSAKLYYNDYDTENPAKRQAIYNLVKGLKDKGVPIDGIGIQGHLQIGSPSVSSMEETINKFSELGVELEVTELDMTMYDGDAGSYTTIPDELLTKEAYRYKEIFEMLKKHKDVIKGVTLWGLKDDMSWLTPFHNNRKDAPLLFDENFKAKQAFWALVDPSRLHVLINHIKTFNGAPIVDGNADAVWDIAGSNKILNNGEQVASFKTLWDEKNLYVLVNVNKAIDSNDAVEVYLDQDNGKNTTVQADDRYYKVSSTGVKNSEKFTASTKEADGGYIAEIAIPFDSISGTAGKDIGFDIRLSSGGTVSSWNDVTNNQATNPSNYGILTLTSPNSTEAVRGTPVIDGQVDEIWQKANTIETNVITLGSNVAKAKVKVLWDENYLYTLAQINDPVLSDKSANVYEQDSIEFFVDENNGRTPAYEADDAQYRVNFKNIKSFGGNTLNDKFITSAKTVNGGYIVEAAVPFNTIKGKAGRIMGFDVQVNDDGNGAGTRTGMANWSDDSTNGWRNTEKFGLLRLVDTASTFSDISNIEWAKEGIEALAVAGVVNGVGNKMFVPERKITRAEFVKMLVSAFKFEDESATCTFSDVRKDKWYYKYVAAAQKLGVINGEGSKFGADESIKQQDAIVMVYRAIKSLNIELPRRTPPLNSPEYTDMAEYAREAFGQLYLIGTISTEGGNKFAPNDYATRAYAADLIYRAFKLFN